MDAPTPRFIVAASFLISKMGQRVSAPESLQEPLNPGPSTLRDFEKTYGKPWDLSSVEPNKPRPLSLYGEEDRKKYNQFLTELLSKQTRGRIARGVWEIGDAERLTAYFIDDRLQCTIRKSTKLK